MGYCQEERSETLTLMFGSSNPVIPISQSIGRGRVSKHGPAKLKLV